MLDRLWTQPADRTSTDSHLWTSPVAAFSLFAAVGIAYFFAARLSLVLLTSPDGVAVFWPAAGVAAGAVIALGSGARVPVALGVVAATIVANLIGDRNLPAAIVFALCNAGEAVLIAWLIERHFGSGFGLDSLRRVTGFFLATGIGAAISGIGGSIGFVLFHSSGAPVIATWLNWFASDAIGVVTTAPAVIGLVAALRDPPDLPVLAEGGFILAIIAVLSAIGFGWPTDHWFTILPLAMVLPLLIWPAARCPMVFAAAAAFIVALVIVWTVSFSVGRLGDASVLLANRVDAAQLGSLAVAACALVAAALFAERRAHEALLNESNEQLRAQEASFRRLLGALPAAVYTTDKAGHITYCNQAAVELWGTTPELGNTMWSDVCRLRHLDGTPMPLDERPTQICLTHGRAIRDREALLERADGTRVPIIPCPAPVFDEHGNVAGCVNMKIDISELKQAEAALKERNAQLELAGRAVRVGSYTVDCDTGAVQLSPGSAAIYGLSEGTVEMSRAEGRACVHPKDLSRLDAQFDKATLEQRRELVAQFRIVRASDGAVRWIEARNLISYDAGRPVRIVGISIDVTERKQAEAVLKENEKRLAEALVAGRVIAFEWDAATRRSRRSTNAVPILGSVECDNFLNQVHPDDRARFKAHIGGLSPSTPAYAFSFRFRRPDGGYVWLEETAKGEFDAAGRLLRVRGLTRDITDRKQAELALEERKLQLSLAGRAGLVGSFAYDIDTEEMQVSEGYAAIHGLPEGTTQMTCAMWKAGVHPEDLERYDELRSRVFREQRREYGAEYRIVRPTGEVRWIEARCFVTYRADGRPLRVVGVNIDITDRKRAEEQQRMLVAELDHRVKNVLATVSAVASRTQDADVSRAEFVAALSGRIRSMAATHELLSRRQWRGISLKKLVQREVAPYATLTNTDIRGPELTLTPEAGQAVSMVLHELTTNAAKHGALSSPNGRACIRWYRVPNGNADARVCIEWRETGGPAVRVPRKSGYGMEVIRDLIPYELAGTVDLVFAPEGLRCDLNIPVGKRNGSDRSTQRQDHVAASA
jgi:PAS domain S-box-containing protein